MKLLISDNWRMSHEFACHNQACAPPPVGAGGSLPGSKGKIKTGKVFGKLTPGATVSVFIDTPGSTRGGGTHGFVVESVGETRPDGRIVVTGHRQRKSARSMGARSETVAFLPIERK